MPPESLGRLHADFISTQHDELMADHEKLKKEEADLEAQTNAIDTTPDCSRKTSQSNARHYRSAATAGQAEML